MGILMGVGNCRRLAPRERALGLAALGLIGACALAQPARAQSGSIFVNPNPGGASVTSNSSTQALQFAPATQTLNQVTQFDTELIGRLNGGTPLYDRSFDAAFATPIVQAGVAAAKAAITSAGGPGVIVTGPTLISHNVTTGSASVSVYSLDPSQPALTTITNTTTFGPATVNGGVPLVIGFTSPNPNFGLYTLCLGVAGLPSTTEPACTAVNGGTLAILAGQTDINVNTNVTQLIDTATTTTDTTTTDEIYEIDGIVRAIGTVHSAVPEAGFDAAERFSRRLLDAGLDGSWSSPPTGVALAANGPLRQIALGGAPMNPAPFSPWHAWAEPYGYVAHTGSSGGFPGDTRSGGGIDGSIGVDFAGGFRIGLS